jgi:hypothetical protein
MTMLSAVFTIISEYLQLVTGTHAEIFSNVADREWTIRIHYLIFRNNTGRHNYRSAYRYAKEMLDQRTAQ